MYGPVPIAVLLRSPPAAFTPASLMMKPQKPPRAASIPAKGSLVMNFTAYLPVGSTLSTAMKSGLRGDERAAGPRRRGRGGGAARERAQSETARLQELAAAEAA